MARTRTPPADPRAFLKKLNGGKSVRDYAEKETIFAQGDVADAVFCIERGRVKLTVVSEHGKEAVLAVLDGGSFFGEGCLTGQPIRMATATAIQTCTIVEFEKQSMLRMLHDNQRFSEVFTTYLLTRTRRVEEDLVDQLFNSSEKRLARILLLLAQFGKEGAPEPVIAKISQETLAGMVGTTRSRISFFMNKFRKLGFIDYRGGAPQRGLQIHSGLLNMVLHD